MTAFWLFLGDVFKWSFQFYELFGNVLYWVLFIVASVIFTYWCYILVKDLGGDEDRDYYSPTAGKYPYYDPKIYKKN